MTAVQRGEDMMSHCSNCCDMYIPKARIIDINTVVSRLISHANRKSKATDSWEGSGNEANTRKEEMSLGTRLVALWTKYNLDYTSPWQLLFSGYHEECAMQ